MGVSSRSINIANRVPKNTGGSSLMEGAKFTGLELKNLRSPVISIKNSVLSATQDYTSSSTSNVRAKWPSDPINCLHTPVYRGSSPDVVLIYA